MVLNEANNCVPLRVALREGPVNPLPTKSAAHKSFTVNEGGRIGFDVTHNIAPRWGAAFLTGEAIDIAPPLGVTPPGGALGGG